MNMSSKIKYLLAASLAVWLVFMYADVGSKDKMDEYIQQYKQFQAQADSAVKFADSLKTQIIIEETEAHLAQEKANEYAEDVKELKKTTSVLKNKRDSLMKETVTPQTVTDSILHMSSIISLQDSIIDQQEHTIDTQDTQIVQLNKALQSKDNVINLLTLSRDSLQKVVINIPQAPKNPNKMFGLPLPSRKVMLVSGFIAGVVTTSVILK
jgi:oligoendopeptidase F